MKRTFAFLAALIALAAMSAAAASAQNNPRAHDRGFFLRLSAGFGHASTGEDFVDASGLSGDANFAIGALVSPGLALHGTLSGWSVTDPEIDLGSVSVETDDVTLSLSGIGPGLTYFFPSSNIYISGSLCAVKLELEYDVPSGSATAETDTGVAFDVTIGKEWWTSDRWGLGLAGAIGFHSVPNDGDSEDLTGTSLALRFSATYN